VYSPKIYEDLIPLLYQVARKRDKPMTRIVDEILRPKVLEKALYQTKTHRGDTGMKEKIECIEVSLESGEIFSRQQSMTRQKLAEFLNNQSLPGTTALVNIRGFYEAKTFVILTKGKVQSMNSENGNPTQGVMNLAPILAFSLDLQGDDTDQRSKASSTSPNKPSGSPANGSNNNGAANNGEKMTTPQRRYLFRLLAEKKNLKGNEAESYLKETCEVESLSDIEKFTASKLIDNLLNGGE
jgi:hypothetical protein